MATREGYCYQTNSKLRQGLQCTATVSPRKNIPAIVTDIFDVVVLGAGYAGLTACRDLSVAGRLQRAACVESV